MVECGVICLKVKGRDLTKVTENIYMQKFFNIVSKEGAEDMMRNEWRNNFSVMDTNKDGLISKAEHQRFFEASKRFDPNGAIVRSIKTWMDLLDVMNLLKLLWSSFSILVMKQNLVSISLGHL